MAPLFGGFAATGAIARTATNMRTGGRTPVAGIVHALVLLAVVLVFAPSPATSPRHPVGDRRGGVDQHGRMARVQGPQPLLAALPHDPADHLLFVTVLFDLTLAVELGMVLASLFFIYRMSDLTRVERLPSPSCP